MKFTRKKGETSEGSQTKNPGERRFEKPKSGLLNTQEEHNSGKRGGGGSKKISSILGGLSPSVIVNRIFFRGMEKGR